MLLGAFHSFCNIVVYLIWPVSGIPSLSHSLTLVQGVLLPRSSPKGARGWGGGGFAQFYDSPEASCFAFLFFLFLLCFFFWSSPSSLDCFLTCLLCVCAWNPCCFLFIFFFFFVLIILAANGCFFHELFL